jgi:hypothetical protein
MGRLIDMRKCQPIQAENKGATHRNIRNKLIPFADED